MEMEYVEDVKFINVYVVRRIYTDNTIKTKNSGKGVITFKTQKDNDINKTDFKDIKILPFPPKIPDNIIEVYLFEHDAIERSLELTKQQDDVFYTSKIQINKHFAIIYNNGKTVTLLDAINTFNVSQLQK